VHGVVGGSSYVASVIDTVCRVVVHAAGDANGTDLSLPGGCPVGVLLPSIVDLVLGTHERPPGPTQWVLTRPGGSALDPSISLVDNAIRDGDLLVLTDVPPPPPRLVPADPIGAVIVRAHSGIPGPAPAATATATPVAIAVLATLLLLAVIETWACRTVRNDSALWVSAAVSGSSAVTAAAAQRIPESLRPVLCAGAVLHAAVTGALAGAGASWPVTLALAAGAALAMAVTLTRVTAGATAVLAGCAVAAAVMLLTAGAAVLTGCGWGSAGALLTVSAIAAVSAAPTIAVLAGGLGPARAAPDARRAQSAHQLLTGLILGGAVAAVAGVTAAVAGRGADTPVSVGFAAAVAALLFLRRRVHCVPVRRTGLATAGFVTAAVGVVAGVTAAHDTAPWWCGGTAMTAAVGLWIWSRQPSPNPVTQRAITIVEYLALAAVIPLAVWVGGGYDLAGGLSLP